MNTQNLGYLSRLIKFTGFGEDHEKDLKMQLVSGLRDFVLLHTQEFGPDRARATLYFHKAASVDLYFFNRYDVEVMTNRHALPVRQTFYISSKADHITFQEAYNLLSGRSVQKEHRPKEGEMHRIWLQLDFKETDPGGQYKFKQYHPNYGFDLEVVLRKHPIQELTTAEGTVRLLESLSRGNRQQVTYGESGKEQKVFIEALPQFKSIRIYDDAMRPVVAAGMPPQAVPVDGSRSIRPEQTVSLSPIKKEFTASPSLTQGELWPQKQKIEEV